ncbi:DUF1353 domain-containing protein [Salmonirosea aquatica]|uniref:DUF1353 domain-containing protein n=1 Tax=Salmonirosea aquatica TaxID=2654236 RepID=A0A7C9BEH3_9BACT|nr:DUF1353 domain-containing protein [Cytophagaceae bacterium SJW1-29]MPR37125.1 DUF1353 domain-containing protein [Cytophagaceae bacterium SJW1-29]
MTRFPRIVVQKVYGEKSDWWALSDPAVIPHPQGEYTIPKGYRTDFISAPWLLYPIIHPHGAGSNEAIPHDYEHENGLFRDQLGDRHARHLSNFMLAVRMVQGKAPIWKVFAMLIYTTLFSSITWNRNNRKK